MFGGRVGRADRNVMRVFFLLAAVLLLSIGVTAIPEEQKPALEQSPQQV